MVYCWFHPKVGLWMGATPELLCKVKNTHFSTMSLAGTQKVIEHEKVYWTEKEKVEQQLVTDYIVNELKLEVKNLKISNPSDVKAGHLWHIKTDIEGEITNKDSLKRIVKKLHPTPAVCGISKEKAKEFIFNNENYNRAFYTGYLGEINVNQSSDLYVNLRCMQVSENEISIYVGGGITHDSLPEKEWEETVAKANTMKNVFF
jgi:isochorismate synthase